MKKKKKLKKVELKTRKGGSIKKKKKKLDELKTWKGDSVRERMISLKWVETWSGDSVWKVEMRDLKGKVEKWVRRILLTLSSFLQGEGRTEA